MSRGFRVGFAAAPLTLQASPGCFWVEAAQIATTTNGALSLTANAGLFSLTGEPAQLNSSGGQTIVFSSLDTGINDGLVFQDDAGGNTGVWMTDGTGGFGRLTWGGPGTAGFRWFGIDTTKRGVYVQYDLRRTSNNNSKEIKLFGKNYPTSYSNHTGGCNAGGYSGTNISNSYSDTTGGGDINTQFFCSAFPSLTGGSSYSRLPHPTAVVTGGGNENITGTWQTRAVWWKQNDDGTANGEYAEFLNGTCIFSCNTMWNCGTGLQGFSRIDWGGYSPNLGLIEDYRKIRVSYDKPAGMGF